MRYLVLKYGEKHPTKHVLAICFLIVWEKLRSRFDAVFNLLSAKILIITEIEVQCGTFIRVSVDMCSNDCRDLKSPDAKSQGQDNVVATVFKIPSHKGSRFCSLIYPNANLRIDAICRITRQAGGMGLKLSLCRLQKGFKQSGAGHSKTCLAAARGVSPEWSTIWISAKNSRRSTVFCEQ